MVKRLITKSVLIEVLVVIVLIIATFFVFKYLGILKKGESANTNPENTVSVSSGSPIVSLITPASIETYKNNGKDFKYHPILSSSIVVKYPLVIDLEIADHGNNSKQGSGYIFNNNLDYNDSSYRHIRLFYSPPEKIWKLELRANNESKSITASYAGQGVNFKKFIISIDATGRKVTISTPNEKNKVITSEVSLYDHGNNMSSIFQIAPQSGMTVYSLYYKY